MLTDMAWPSKASHIAQNCGESALRAIQGYMEFCDQCGRPFRRMATSPRPARFICGACYPAAPGPLVDADKSEYGLTSSLLGRVE